MITKKHMETRGEYCKKHDAFYNPIKNSWIDENCGDTNCRFCKDRPDKPSEVKK